MFGDGPVATKAVFGHSADSETDPPPVIPQVFRVLLGPQAPTMSSKENQGSLVLRVLLV